MNARGRVEDQPVKQWKTLDKDLNRISRLEQGTMYLSRPLVGPGIALSFIVVAAIAASVIVGHQPAAVMVVTASIFGAYLALNIGANDVANNMGPAVGANALSLGWALAIAAVCEAAGALLAGGDVINTLATGIVHPSSMAEPQFYAWAMMSATIGAGLWLNLATLLRAPVSTTHSVVGGIVGASVTAAGVGTVNWGMIGSIAATWLLSPLMGGTVAAMFLAFIKARITYQEDKLTAARFWVPVLIGLMVGVFTTYLCIIAFSRVLVIPPSQTVLIGLAAGLATWLISRPLIQHQSEGLENRKKSLKKLFSGPLVLSAALLSFAHGANDVANAVGPLAAIVDAARSGDVAARVVIPIWVVAIGAAGISFGVILFGPRLIRIVGSQITKLNPMRAYCVSLSAAIVVIFASWLGLPVSTTHIIVGGVFGVGFYREWHAERQALRRGSTGKFIPPEERSRRKLVRRAHFMTIMAAWVVTVPAAALLSALVFALLRAFAS